jgi:hypothetical protein
MFHSADDDNDIKQGLAYTSPGGMMITWGVNPVPTEPRKDSPEKKHKKTLSMSNSSKRYSRGNTILLYV